MHDFVNLGREGWRGGFVIVVVIIVILFGDFDKGEKDSIAGLCSEGVKMKVGKESTLGAEGYGVRIGATATPKNSFTVVGEVEIVVAPVDIGIDSCQPGLSQDEVVIREGVDEGIEMVGIVVAIDREGAGKRGDRRGAVGKDDRNW